MLLAITALAFVLLNPAGAGCENPFEFKRVGNIHPYADNAFFIRSDEGGTLSIRIHDDICTYRELIQHIESGETTVRWDGCGYNREKLYEKTYTVSAELITDSGLVHSISFQSPIEYADQCLQYALPSSGHLYMDAPETWFLEYRTVKKGSIVIEMTPVDSSAQLYTYTLQTTGGKIARKDFTSIRGKKVFPACGSYSVCVYESSRPVDKHTFTLQISEHAPESDQVAVTGEILADRGMSESEIWDMMMQPSVVVDIDFFKHQNVYEMPDTSSRSLGTLHGQTQGLKVIRISGDWTLIGAWNHEDAEYIEGWVPLNKLKVEYPRSEYAILIDKQLQTMSVFQNGHVIDTLLISTGRAEKGSLYQETSAGFFLTGYHRVNFSMNGKKYDYVIQYDGGNLLHQTPYDWGQYKKDFTLGRGYLGAKASHACVRIQPEPGAGGLNAYWLFTHIPYHTRVMILDDPDERKAVAGKLSRPDHADVSINSLHSDNGLTVSEKNSVTLTFGGRLAAGGTKVYNERNDSFASFTSTKGYDIPLSRLCTYFQNDDLTSVSLVSHMEGKNTFASDGKAIGYGPYGTAEMFSLSSVEMIRMTDDSLYMNGSDKLQETAEEVSRYASVLLRDQTKTYTLKGHLFGFACCSEKEYLSEPGIIDKRLSILKDQGCERLILLMEWHCSQDNTHSVTQEAMARRGVMSGADLIIGCSQGTVGGIDYIRGVPVIYSLGDLLDGSTNKKPRSQQGILIRTVFNFDNESEKISVAVIPILPYGNTDKKMNDFRPTDDLSISESLPIIRSIWSDSTDPAMDRTLFHTDGHS